MGELRLSRLVYDVSRWQPPVYRLVGMCELEYLHANLIRLDLAPLTASLEGYLCSQENRTAARKNQRLQKYQNRKAELKSPLLHQLSH